MSEVTQQKKGGHITSRPEVGRESDVAVADILVNNYLTINRFTILPTLAR